MQLLEDIITVLKTLQFVDYVLYFSVLILLILIISLVYVIKNEDEVIFKDEEISNEEELDLKEIVKNIDTRPEPIIDMTKYETEQEEKAIISYDELVNTAKLKKLNYLEEETLEDDIKVKKIDLSSLGKFDEEQEIEENVTEYPPKINVRLISYNHEEAFLKALKDLEKLLN